MIDRRQLKLSISNAAAEYAKLPFIPPYLQPGFNNYTYGVNFASAGAGALPESFQGFVSIYATSILALSKLKTHILLLFWQCE